MIYIILTKIDFILLLGYQIYSAVSGPPYPNRKFRRDNREGVVGAARKASAC
ncbi:hypothetical protein WH47_07178 [Habropoda laboriosa]|uniref:Uncharacterized protein n=1 Tax=Habropoda laboriosa TaxID=597456 RepID=A0A0L7QR75_9HYME|nr:hypothetical protein WH47_07178 [Habropoda laboriosa]